MTYQEREQILSKDVLTINELCKLLGCNYQLGARKMREIKYKHDRLHERGKLHVQDYLDYYGIKSDRYKYENRL